MIDSKRLDLITGDDIRSLVVSCARETRFLEFKRELYDLDDPNGRREALLDVAAFANSDGGDIVLGIEEKEEIAVEIRGMPRDAATAFVKRLTDLLQTGLQPPLTSVATHVVPLDETGRAVTVIRVRYSSAGPHREASSRHFPERTSTSRVYMDVNAIRSAFLRQDVVLNAFDQFRSDRLRLLTTEPTLRQRIGDYPTLVVHGAPLHALARHSRRFVDWREVEPHIWRDYLGRARDRYNAEGYEFFSPASGGPSATGLNWGAWRISGLPRWSLRSGSLRRDRARRSGAASRYTAQSTLLDMETFWFSAAALWYCSNACWRQRAEWSRDYIERVRKFLRVFNSPRRIFNLSGHKNRCH